MASIFDNFGPSPLLQPLGLFDSINNPPVYTDTLNNSGQQFNVNSPSLYDYFSQPPATEITVNNPQTPTIPSAPPGSRTYDIQQNQNAPAFQQEPARPNNALNSSFQNALSNIFNQIKTFEQSQNQAPQPNPNNTPATQPATSNPYKLSDLNQNWMKANEGTWGSDLMKFMLSGGANQFNFDPMNISYMNESTGQQENIQRALGVIQSGGADALAKILGGRVQTSPLATFGTNQRDQYIYMPNGQMIDASALANQLKNAAQSSNPFSALSDTIGLYKYWNDSFDPRTNTDIMNQVNKGIIKPMTPPAGWTPPLANLANQNTRPQTQTNQAMPPTTANPAMPPSGQPTTSLPGPLPIQPPAFPGFGPTTQTAAPQGMNTNWQYYTPQGRQGNMFGNQGLYAQGMTGGGGGGGNASYGIPSAAGSQTQGAGVSANNPFGTPRNPSTTQVAGNLPNGSTVLGNR